MSEAFEACEVDGIPMVFRNTPDTGAPSAMNALIPSMKALWMAENVTHGLQDIYPFRGRGGVMPAALSLIAGHALGGSRPDRRAGLAIATVARNLGLALYIAESAPGWPRRSRRSSPTACSRSCGRCTMRAGADAQVRGAGPTR